MILYHGSICGVLTFDSAGVYTLRLLADEIKRNGGVGLAVTEVRLEPVITNGNG